MLRAVRRFMGQGGVGALLELGPEGDMGGCHLVGVLDLYPLSPSSSLALFGGVGAFGFSLFLLLQVCWIGVNYLPSARGYSVHTYNME